MTKVRELMRLKSGPVHGIQKGATIVEAARAFVDEELGSLLVYDGEELVGIFTKNDLSRRCIDRRGDLRDVRVGDGLATEVFTTTPDAGLDEAFDEMIRRGCRHMPVLEDGRAVGMLTPIDILLYQKDTAHFENEVLVEYIQGSY